MELLFTGTVLTHYLNLIKIKSFWTKSRFWVWGLSEGAQFLELGMDLWWINPKNKIRQVIQSLARRTDRQNNGTPKTTFCVEGGL
jgi:hypothetical protein